MKTRVNCQEHNRKLKVAACFFSSKGCCSCLIGMACLARLLSLSSSSAASYLVLIFLALNDPTLAFMAFFCCGFKSWASLGLDSASCGLSCYSRLLSSNSCIPWLIHWILHSNFGSFFCHWEVLLSFCRSFFWRCSSSIALTLRTYSSCLSSSSACCSHLACLSSYSF